MICEFPNNFFLPDGKNSRLSQIVNKWIFNRQTPDGNEGVGVEIAYLECTYVISQVYLAIFRYVWVSHRVTPLCL